MRVEANGHNTLVTPVHGRRERRLPPIRTPALPVHPKAAVTSAQSPYVAMIWITLPSKKSSTSKTQPGQAGGGPLGKSIAVPANPRWMLKLHNANCCTLWTFCRIIAQ